jgi:hypothetical protein
LSVRVVMRRNSLKRTKGVMEVLTVAFSDGAGGMF